MMTQPEYMTVIASNGSKWAGDSPDPIDTLFDRLAREPLDPSFEEFGNFCYPAHRAKGYRNGSWEVEYLDLGPIYPDHPEAVRFWGNFANLSAVFEVDTDDPDLIARLTSAIRANQATDAYQRARAQWKLSGPMPNEAEEATP